MQVPSPEDTGHVSKACTGKQQPWGCICSHCMEAFSGSSALSFLSPHLSASLLSSQLCKRWSKAGTPRTAPSDLAGRQHTAKRGEKEGEAQQVKRHRQNSSSQNCWATKCRPAKEQRAGPAAVVPRSPPFTRTSHVQCHRPLQIPGSTSPAFRTPVHPMLCCWPLNRCPMPRVQRGPGQ